MITEKQIKIAKIKKKVETIQKLKAMAEKLKYIFCNSGSIKISPVIKIISLIPQSTTRYKQSVYNDKTSTSSQPVIN